MTTTLVRSAAAPFRCTAADAVLLAQAFDRAGITWRRLAEQLNADPSALLAHTPSAAPNNSDLGEMLAWTEVVQERAASGNDLRLECGDPWLFRHFASIPGVKIEGRAPPLWPQATRLWVRGVAARLKTALRVALLAATTRRKACSGAPALLVYGHPASRADGQDAYFGRLMHELPGLCRMLHVDAAPSRLADDRRSASLHAWGSPWYALWRLPFAKWRPSAKQLSGPYRWLIRRAAALEGGSGQAAAVAWQIHCQGLWLARERPRTVAWPWESHGWERALVIQARALGIRTIGHQHSVIGQQFNIGGVGPHPDIVAANGPSGRDQLVARGVPAEIIRVAGTLRLHPPDGPAFDPNGPLFLAVPFDDKVAGQMIAAARPLAEAGITVLVRDHPLFPIAFEETDNLRRAPGSLQSMPGVRAVLFAATTVGLEALLAGLPVFRFVPVGCIAVDILPQPDLVPAITADGVADAVRAVTAPAAPPRWDAVFAPADMAFWREQLA